MLLKKIQNSLVECKNFMNTWEKTSNIQKWQKKMEFKEKFLSSLLFGKTELLKMLRLLKVFTKLWTEKHKESLNLCQNGLPGNKEELL